MVNIPNNTLDTQTEERFTDLETGFKVNLEYPEYIKEIIKKQNLSLKSVDELAFLRGVAFMVHEEDLEYGFKVLAEDLEDVPLKNAIDSNRESILAVIEPSTTGTGKASNPVSKSYPANLKDLIGNDSDIGTKLKEHLKKMPNEPKIILD